MDMDFFLKISLPGLDLPSVGKKKDEHDSNDDDVRETWRDKRRDAD